MIRLEHIHRQAAPLGVHWLAKQYSIATSLIISVVRYLPQPAFLREMVVRRGGGT